MSSPFDPVNPGDLITADRWNQMLAYFQDVEQRLVALETAAPAQGPTIQPTSPTIPTTIRTFRPTFTVQRPTLTAITPRSPLEVATLLNPVIDPSDPVTNIAGIGNAEETMLAQKSINNMGTLASSKVEDISQALGVPLAEANRIQGNAKALLGL